MPERAEGRSRLTKLVLWATFVLICFGLGYPTLNRYDPRQLLPDAATYAKLAQDGPANIASPFRFRILIPFMARSVAALAKGRTGTWDPLLFGFLVVNSLFAATTAFLISVIGESLLGDSSPALFASTLYLLNFAISNAHLAGLVDSGEAVFLMAIVVSMFFRRWPLLPLFGVLGALTKESFVPFSIAMTITWLLISPDIARRRSNAIWVVTMIAAECATVIALQSAISGHLVWPWSFAAGLDSHPDQDVPGTAVEQRARKIRHVVCVRIETGGERPGPYQMAGDRGLERDDGRAFGGNHGHDPNCVASAARDVGRNQKPRDRHCDGKWDERFFG